MRMRQREILNKINIDFARDGETQADYIKRKIEMILSATKEYLLYSSAKGFLLCLSGGIDSYVSAALMADAAKGINGMLHLLLTADLPEDMQSAHLCADALISQFDNITCEELPLLPVLSEINKNINKSIFSRNFDQFRKVNTEARLRMIYQYALSKDLLVVGTVHATEKVIGHYTKYGEGGSDYNPLDGLIKIDIYDIARIYKAPESVLNERPDAGFEITGYEDDGPSITYPELSQYLTGNLLEKEKMQRIVTMYDKTEHKRNMPASPVNVWWRKQREDYTHIVINMTQASIDQGFPCINQKEAVLNAATYIDAHPEMRVLYVRDNDYDPSSFVGKNDPLPEQAAAEAIRMDSKFYHIQRTINSPLERYNIFSKKKEIESGFDAVNDIYGALKYNITGHVVISGFIAEVCVLGTVKDLIKNGFHVFVLRDALAYVNKEAYDDALREMAILGAAII